MGARSFSIFLFDTFCMSIFHLLNGVFDPPDEWDEVLCLDDPGLNLPTLIGEA